MSKFFSFAAGLMSGSLVGAAAALLLAPRSGPELQAEARARWDKVLAEAEIARERTRQELEMQFERMKESGKF